MSLISEQTQVDSMYDELVTQQEMTQILTSSEKKPLNETATLKREVISTMPSRFKCEGCGGVFDTPITRRKCCIANFKSTVFETSLQKCSEHLLVTVDEKNTHEIPKRKRLSLKVLYERLENGKFKCKCCNMTYKKQNTMSQHVKFKHTEPQELCPHGCKEKFHTRQQVKQHSINVHSVEKPFKCDYCSQSSKQKGNLKAHMKRCKSNPENQ